MGSRRLLVTGALLVAVAASPMTCTELRPSYASIEADVKREEARSKGWASKRRTRPRVAVAARPTMVRHHGRARWSLEELPRIEDFFQSAFGRALPISAYGQTALHSQLGFDHRDAVDVAIHPDSREGIALQRFLRDGGIPFMVARRSVEGAATGAHIHIGRPSQRLTAVALSTP
jgi:hypothetical protein